MGREFAAQVQTTRGGSEVYLQADVATLTEIISVLAVGPNRTALMKREIQPTDRWAGAGLGVLYIDVDNIICLFIFM